MRRRVILLTVLLTACMADVEPTPSPAAVDPPADIVAWAVAAKNMVWRHTVQGVPPNMQLERVERCGDFAIVFFLAPRDGPVDADLLWAAGFTSEQAEGADGGWTNNVQRDLEPYRAEHGPCEIAFDR